MLHVYHVVILPFGKALTESTKRLGTRVTPGWRSREQQHTYVKM